MWRTVHDKLYINYTLYINAEFAFAILMSTLAPYEDGIKEDMHVLMKVNISE